MMMIPVALAVLIVLIVLIVLVLGAICKARQRPEPTKEENVLWRQPAERVGEGGARRPARALRQREARKF
jgi:hypothetical protein